MPSKFDITKRFEGLDTLHDPSDIGNKLSGAQNISIDKRGIIRTIGGLETHGEVPTQAAIIAPGSGLEIYGSDHWRGTDTIVDLLPNSTAVSDEQTEADAITGWEAYAASVLTSEVTAELGFPPSTGTYAFKTTGKFKMSAAVTVVVGQRYVLSADLRADDITTSFFVGVGTADESANLGSSSLVSAINEWQTKTIEFIATTTSVYVTVAAATGNGFADNMYLTKIPRRDLDTNWLALADVANAQVDLYNSNDDSFTAGLLDFGTVSSYTGAAAAIDFPTVSSITGSASAFLNEGFMAGQLVKVSGCSTTTANNILFVADRVVAGTIYARGSPFTVTAAEAGTVTLTKYNPTAFHYVSEALRASPVGGGIALRPKHYSFVDRYHLKGSDSSEDQYQAWYANDVGPVKPTDIAFDAAVDSGVSGNLSAGAGWEVGMTVTADGGDWPAGTYIIACFHTYDDGQMSALYVPSTDMAMTAITEGASLTLCAKALGPYDERISGGGICCRLDETDDPWILLLDISMAEGARTTLQGTWNAWAEGATVNTAYTASCVSLAPNVDSYESLAGVDPGIKIEVFNGNDRFWNTSVIAGNRCFIGSVRYDDEGGKTSHYRDRILYSQVGEYDTFAIDNYIDVVQGDAEDYVKLGVYGDDLLCYKASTLYIIDISDPDSAGWQMKQDANKGKYPFRGIRHPGAYFETPYGPVWCNEFGVFLYDGNEIVELLKDKIELSEHPLARRRYYEFTTDDYISCGVGVASLGTAGTIYVEFRVDDTTPTAAATLVANSTGANDRTIIQLNTDGDLRGTYYNGSNHSKSGSVGAAGWHSAAFTYDGSTPLLYLDLVSQTGTNDPLTNAGDNLYIGARQGTPDKFWEGGIARVLIYDTNLSLADLTLLHNGTPADSISGLIGRYEPKDIGDATWDDTGSGNKDGTVVGATAIYEDSWAKFYTDYSILGYHAKTNQIIIMRDCTGKWSSGQDYGDCMIIDLDTGDITTGRRVFTKGVAYTNFARDWNRDLIIGEQSSTNVITKKWTDEPQSQAAGLIEIITADMDFGNPATAKDIDAIIHRYKSSAAQTTPVSYAIDGDDRQTAWTRIAGNFDAETNWEKLTLEPSTPIPCDSIRLKIDNPTSAGTIELNDRVIVYREIPEDIS